MHRVYGLGDASVLSVECDLKEETFVAADEGMKG